MDNVKSARSQSGAREHNTLSRERERERERLGENSPLLVSELGVQSVCVYIQHWGCQSMELSQLADIADSHLVHRKQMRIISSLKFIHTGNLGEIRKGRRRERDPESKHSSQPPRRQTDSSLPFCMFGPHKKKERERERGGKNPTRDVGRSGIIGPRYT